MRVGIVDNTCNMGYVLMRYLNDAGIDTDLITLRKPAGGHADPESDTFSRQYFDKIVHSEFGGKNLFLRTPREFRRLFDNYDFVLGSDIAPALFKRMKRRLDVFMPHGTDLFTYPFPEPRIVRYTTRQMSAALLGQWQRAGIEQFTDRLLFDLTNDDNESYILKLRKPGFERVMVTMPLLYQPQYESTAWQESASQCAQAQMLARLRADGYKIFFHHCQQQWKDPAHELFNKGNDVLLHALRQLLDERPAFRFRVVMIERGTDVETSKELIGRLRLGPYVIWMKEMPRKAIMACLTHTDLGIGELARSWYSYNVVMEFLVMGVPVIHNCDLDYYKTIHPNPYPMFPVKNVAALSRLLVQFADSPKPFFDTGRQGLQWWKTNILHTAINLLRGWIKEKAELRIA